MQCPCCHNESTRIPGSGVTFTLYEDNHCMWCDKHLLRYYNDFRSNFPTEDAIKIFCVQAKLDPDRTTLEQEYWDNQHKAYYIPESDLYFACLYKDIKDELLKRKLL